ncbi:hypothetical protein [Bradyrhizobium sp. CB3481]|uniref:hypothetical protein n=1 Tax=Bradyrhizobium sp. CB3481 TaxID=3039158 RepID=UPI0032C2448C
MVLDAVARIEESLSAQREETLQREAALQREEGLSAQQAAEAVAAAAVAQVRLTEALDAIRGAVDAAEESAVEAIDSLALEQRLAPVRKGARVLREIAWRLREIGNDGRICDLIDSQVTVIERGTEQFSSEEARIALRAAFAALQGRLVEFGDDTPPALDPDAMPFPAMQEMPAEAVEAVSEAAKEAAEGPFAPMAAPAAEAVLMEAETPPAPELSIEPAAAEKAAAVEAAAEQAVAQALAAQDIAAQDLAAQDALAAQDVEVQDDAVQENAAQRADAQDEAVLDIIAMEMGAPDPINDVEIAEAAAQQARAEEPAPTAPKIVAEAPEPAAPPAPPPVQQVVQPPPPPAAAPTPAVEVSLGSTLIATGVVRKPILAANDPLAPIRRMSQAEKLAFFS